jgi:lipoprotein-releasing system ATP-binding protein
MNPDNILIKAENLHKTYRNAMGGAERRVLAQLDLVIRKKEKVAIMGPSGSGKTTLLNLIGTLDIPDSGMIRFEGRSLSDLDTGQVLAFRNRTAGFVFQFHHLLPQCTLLENVLLPSIPNKGDRSAANHRAEDLLQFMGIWDQRHNKPAELSGGECQRAAVARALINQPKILLADEPTGSLDEENASLLMELLMGINEEMGVSLIVATHSPAIARRMDTVYRIADGKLVHVTDME